MQGSDKISPDAPDRLHDEHAQQRPIPNRWWELIRRRFWSTSIIVLYILFTIVGVGMATGFLFPNFAFADAASQVSADGVYTQLFVPPHLYLYSFLGALAHVFIVMYLNPVFLRSMGSFRHQLVWASVRIPLAVLLATGVFLLSALLGLEFTGRALAGIAFLVGLYVRETVMAFVAVVQRLFSDPSVSLEEFYFGESSSSKGGPTWESKYWGEGSYGLTVVIVTLYLGLTLVGTAMASGLLLPEIVFADPSTILTGDRLLTDVFVPPHMYLFSLLGALAHVFIVMFLKPVFRNPRLLQRQIIWASVRIPLAVLLVTGFYLLTNPLGLNFSGQTLAGVSFLVGLYVKETVTAFVVVVQRLFKVEGVDLQEFYFDDEDEEEGGEVESAATGQSALCSRCEEHNSGATIVDGNVICFDCITPEERKQIQTKLSSEDPGSDDAEPQGGTM